MKNHAVYTRGSIGGAMMRTALGMLAGTLAMSGYNLADAYFVGQLPGAEPLAAMGFTFPVVMLAVCVFRGLCIGMATTAAHAIGAGNPVRAARLVTAGLLILTATSVAVGLAGLATADALFAAFGARGVTLDLVKDYMDVWYLGCFTASLALAGNDLLLTVGAPKTASVVMLAGMVANVALDPLFIFGAGPIPEMGLRGAAWATVISQGLSAALVLRVVGRRYRLLTFRRMGARHLRALGRVIVRFAVPAMLGMLMMPIGSAALTWLTASFGDAAVAAAATAGRLEGLAFVVPMAFGMTMTPFIGQNYGARLYSRVRQCRRFAMRFALGYLLVAAVAFFLFSGGLVALFTGDAEVRRLMALYLRIVPWGFGALEISRFATFVYTGCGRPKPAAWLNALRMLGLLLPFSLVAWAMESITGLFVARLVADLLAGAIGWGLTSRMTGRLPEDGRPDPLHADGDGALAEPTFSAAV